MGMIHRNVATVEFRNGSLVISIPTLELVLIGASAAFFALVEFFFVRSPVGGNSAGYRALGAAISGLGITAWLMILCMLYMLARNAVVARKQQ